MVEGNLTIRPLRADDDRSEFHSGDPDLERFFLKYAGRNQFKHHLGQTYVAAMDTDIIGYVTVTAGHIRTDDVSTTMKKRLPEYPLPVLRLARLAVDKRAQGEGVGLQLLKFVLNLAKDMEKIIGCVGVVVDAKLESVPFYEKFGVVEFEAQEGALSERPTPKNMFLPLGAIPR